MGDRAWVGVTFYDVPEKDVPLVLKFLIDQGLVDYKEREVIIGEQYTAEEMNLSWPSDEVIPLVEQCPGITVEALQSNRYEFNGESLYHRPDLGTYLGEAEGGGDLILNQMAVDEAFTKLDEDATAGDLHAALLRMLGQPWVNEFAKLRNEYSYENREEWPVLTGPEDLAQALEDMED